MIGEMELGYAAQLVAVLVGIVLLVVTLGVAFEKFEDRDRDQF